MIILLNRCKTSVKNFNEIYLHVIVQFRTLILSILAKIHIKGSLKNLASLGRLELPPSASEADTLSTELQGRDFLILPRRVSLKAVTIMGGFERSLCDYFLSGTANHIITPSGRGWVLN